jgi:hypothetical protein
VVFEVELSIFKLKVQFESFSRDFEGLLYGSKHNPSFANPE